MLAGVTIGCPFCLVPEDGLWPWRRYFCAGVGPAELSIRFESSDKLRFVLPIVTAGPTFPLGVDLELPMLSRFFAPSSSRF